MTDNLKSYEIRYKKTARARTILTWTRFAPSEQAARASATKALNETYYGDAVLVSVEECADPR